MDFLQSVAKDYGLFAALTCYVLWFFDRLIKQNRADHAERESRYISVIDKLSDSYVELQKDVESIKTMMERDRDRRGA